MASNSAIEWTGSTWNCIVGCSILSPGCINCYAMDEAARQIRCSAALGRETHYAGTVETVKGKAVWTGKLAMAPDHILLQPLKRKKPTTYFVNSMGDLFHEDVPDEWIDKVFAVMALCPQHTFQVLTKRAKRMREYFNGPYKDGNGVCARIAEATAPLVPPEKLPAPPIIYNVPVGPRLPNGEPEFGFRRMMSPRAWPLPNVWLGVSTERQQEADERIPELLQTPAAVRFISAEPLLGPIDLKRWMPSGKWGTFNGEPVFHQKYFITKCEHCGWFGSSELCTEHSYGDDADVVCPSCGKIFSCDEVDAKLHWVISGGESGSGARPSHPGWYRALRDQCHSADVPYFFKQWGMWKPLDQFDTKVIKSNGAHAVIRDDGRFVIDTDIADPPRAVFTFNVGKKAAGRHLDGKLHDGMPQRADGKGR